MNTGKMLNPDFTFNFFKYSGVQEYLEALEFEESDIDINYIYKEGRKVYIRKDEDFVYYFTLFGRLARVEDQANRKFDTLIYGPELTEEFVPYNVSFDIRTFVNYKHSRISHPQHLHVRINYDLYNVFDSNNIQDSKDFVQFMNLQYIHLTEEMQRNYNPEDYHFNNNSKIIYHETKPEIVKYTNENEKAENSYISR